MSFDERALIEYVLDQRWYGAKSRLVAHAQVLDSVVVRTAEPQFALALVEMRYDTGAHDIYQLLYSLRDGELQIDGLEDPHLARELVSAMRSGLTLQGAEGVVEFAPIEGFAGLGRELLEVRPVGAEQSNTSVVFDERADPQGLPPARAGDQPRARDAAVPHRARLCEHRAPRRVVRVLRRPDRRDARHPPAVRPRRDRRLGARARRARRAPGCIPRAAAPPRRGHGRDAHRARLRSERPRVLPRDAVGRVARPADGNGRRGDRAGLPGAPGGRRARAGESSAAARRCASSCAC